MTFQEANTAFAVIANWRGNALDEGERAAWKNQLLRMDFDEFNFAIEQWGRGTKVHLRPSLAELWALLPRTVESGRVPDFPPKDDEPITTGASAAMRSVVEQFAHLRRPPKKIEIKPNEPAAVSSPEVNR